MYYNVSCNLFRSSQKRTGRWTHEEHARFLKAIRLYGKDWKKIEKFVGTRSGSQVRSHAQKYFLKLEESDCSDRSEDIPDIQPDGNIIPNLLEKDMNTLHNFHLQAYLDALKELHRSYIKQMEEIYMSTILKPLSSTISVKPIISKPHAIGAFPFPKELPSQFPHTDYEVSTKEEYPYKKHKCK